jgi:hypothetical protein
MMRRYRKWQAIGRPFAALENGKTVRGPPERRLPSLVGGIRRSFANPNTTGM